MGLVLWFCLVVDGDLDLLLRRGNDVIFCFALEAGELGDGFLDDGQRLLEFFLGDDQWRRKADDVLVGRFGLGLLVWV